MTALRAGLVWLCAASPLAAGCAEEAMQREDRPADRTGKQYATGPLASEGDGDEAAACHVVAPSA